MVTAQKMLLENPENDGSDHRALAMYLINDRDCSIVQNFVKGIS